MWPVVILVTLFALGVWALKVVATWGVGEYGPLFGLAGFGIALIIALLVDRARKRGEPAPRQDFRQPR